LERIFHSPEQGKILLEGPEETAIWKILIKKGFSGKQGVYGRVIDFCAQPLLDRGAEIGALLLDQGYWVQIEEAAIREKILARDYEPEHTHWVLAAEQEDQLLLRYPYDAVLNRYVRMAGGKWNGQEMQLPIRSAEKVEELIQLYSFRCTKEARKRLDLWQQALENATIYRQRPWKERYPTASPEDMFHQMLKKDRPVLPDLQENP